MAIVGRTCDPFHRMDWRGPERLDDGLLRAAAWWRTSWRDKKADLRGEDAQVSPPPSVAVVDSS